MCNRDERTARPAALPPRWWQVDGDRAMFPLDPMSGGTWISVNESGLAIALLNRAPAVARPRRSRGTIVPCLMAAGGMSDVVNRLRTFEPADYERFRVVAARRGQLLVATSDGAALDIERCALSAPMVCTSSSLGDAYAERLRCPLFERLVARAADPVGGQRRFHDHRWADCPAFSVRMRRNNAYTVSRSIATVDADHVTFEYEPLPPV